MMKKDSKKPRTQKASRPKLPSGWDEKRIRKVLTHYENQTEDEAVAEDEAAYEAEGQTVMIVPTQLVPAVRWLIGRRGGVRITAAVWRPVGAVLECSPDFLPGASGNGRS